MAKYIVTGGRQRTRGEKTKEWLGYDQAVALLFDDNTLSAEPYLLYETPQERLPDHPEAAITFKSCSLSGDELLAATTTEILRVSLVDKKIVSEISLPCFNDVHHVFQNTAGNYVVTATGLDAVFELDQTGRLINEWSTTENDIWKKFDRQTDYRKVLTTKPHEMHPNHSVEVDGTVWVTRLKSEDLMNCQTRESIAVPFGPPHDGQLVNDSVYFTHVNGQVSRVSIAQRKAEVILDARAVYADNVGQGWCRGLYLEDESEAILGFTRLRPTKAEDMYQRTKRLFASNSGYQGARPTRIAKFDLRSAKLLWEFDLEPNNINAVFSILKISD